MEFLHTNPPRSPDLAIWGIHQRSRVHTTCVYKFALQQRICDALQTVNSETLQRVWQELAYRNGFIRVTKGSYIHNIISGSHIRVTKGSHMRKTNYHFSFTMIY